MSIGNYYEVFLSFRGPDTRHNFADHLYHGLIRAGIHAFRDDDNLTEGEKIRPELSAAIRNSKILIPILSETYGASNWCLDELVQIIECKNNSGHKVLPIFYKVAPSEVRNQTGKFGTAFREHEEKFRENSSFNSTILGKWTNALREVGTLKGYEANRSEAELVEVVVQKALRELETNFKLAISEDLVGIDNHINKVMEFVDNKSNVTLFIGIHGMGGIGKTTLAKAIYNKLCNQFENRSFITDIRESCKHNKMVYLQNKLISDILKHENKVYDENQGTTLISSRFKGKKVLIVLDDVDKGIQLKCLAGQHDWFSSGSRIIITTRDKRVLEEVEVHHAYEHNEMDDDQSLTLFSKHAFRSDFPPRDFEHLAHEVVSIAGGLPLFLEVVGSLLWEKNPTMWRCVIKKLKEVPCNEVKEKLRISYEALDDNQKKNFLDIACFFIGTDKRIASYMWEACNFYPREGLKVLISMSLIKVGDDHKLRMNDHLRDLGREIVREKSQQRPWRRSRLWDCEEVQEVLKKNKGTKKIEAINLSKGSSEGSSEIAEQDGDIYTEKQFKKLTRLRFLYMKGAHLSGDFKDSLEELRWLRWQKCPRNFEVNNFHVKKLAVLELPESKINDKWEGWNFFMMAENLKFLNLSNCDSLENTNFLSAFKKLEVLILNCCWGLKQIDSSIGDMKTLLRLELSKCENLRELPTKIGKLKALKQLLLRHTQSLSTLPHSIGSLENLEILDISFSGIEQLPNGIGRLRKLRKLCALDCSNLKGEMVESMCNLSSLKCLDFLGCFNLQSLPDLPSSLTYLRITCQSRKLTPLSNLTHLKELRVWDCKSLECIQVLPSILLKNSECSQLRDAEESESPRSLNMPFKLEILEVYCCNSIQTLDVSQFINLRTLYADSCKKLLEVRGLDKLKSLESLIVARCNSIKRLDLLKFDCLKKLDARNCKKLVEIQGLDSLEYLERLDIEGCTSIERLDLPKFGRLKELKAGGCKKLAKIQGLNLLKYLERLDIEGCTLIERLDLPKSGRLKKLEVRDCEKLAEIQGLNRLEFLEPNIFRCKSLQTILEFGSEYSDDSEE